MDHSLDVVIEFGEDTAFGHAADGSVVFVADFVFHKLGFEKVVHAAFGFFGAFFALTAVNGRGFYKLAETFGLFPAVQNVFYYTMNRKVGIAADRRRKMAIKLGGKSEMPEVLRAIFGFCHRPERNAVYYVFDVVGRAFEKFFVVVGGRFFL